MCGLIGWVGKDPKDFNKDKFDKLGMFNIERGKHSCGVAIDGKLYKGIDENANFAKFIINENYPLPSKIPVVIGHTRHATVGIHNEKNAHPFKFNLNKGFVIGAHNGTLTNYIELSKKYNINPTNKIDSKILLEIIANGNINVLSEYEGAAALLIYSSLNPNTIYIFRGESKKFYNGTMDEERPLFFYQENKNSLYISSLKDSLKAITNTKEEKNTSIFKVKPNRLYEITNGQIVNKFIIDRSKINSKSKNYTKHTSIKTNIKGKVKNNTCNIVVKNEKENNIYYEKIIFTNIKQEIYFENFRFKRNGHLVTSICIFVKELGFLRICKDIKDLKKHLIDFKYYDKTIESSLNLGNLNNTTIYYIHNGILLKNELDYVTCINRENHKKCTYLDYSFMSFYPVIDYKKKYKCVIKNESQNIILENKLYTGTFRPIGSFASYNCVNGRLINKIEFDDLKIPNNAITLYNSINDDDFLNDDDVIDEFNSITDIEMIDDIIEIANQINETNEYINYLLKYKNSNKLIDTILEYGEYCKLSFEQINNDVSSLMNQKMLIE